MDCMASGFLGLTPTGSETPKPLCLRCLLDGGEMSGALERLRIWATGYPVPVFHENTIENDLTALRDALQDHWDHDETWCFACHRSLDECSAAYVLDGRTTTGEGS